MIVALIPHPAFPPARVQGIDVQVVRNQEGGLWLEYIVTGSAGLILPPPADPRRTDELWRTTCFELFCRRPGAGGYCEFNFSPSFQWAAYAFDAYRSGMRALAAETPDIEISLEAEPLFLAAEPWPPALTLGEIEIALAAVIEEEDGTKSYWALAHPGEQPDFHHPESFTLRLD